MQGRRKPQPTTLAAITLMTTMIIVPVAFGQQPPGIDAPDPTSAARELFNRAHAARDAKNYQDCYEWAHGAWKLKRTGGVSALIGDCAYNLKKYREAAERLTWFFEHPVEKPTALLLAQMRERLDNSKKHIATVNLTASVPDASLTLDGKATQAGVVFVDPGEHTFEARADGYKPAKLAGTFSAGTEREVALELEPTVQEPPPPPPPPNGTAPPPSNDAYPWIVGTGAALTLIGVGLAIGFTVAANNRSSDAEALLTKVQVDHPSGCTDAIAACGELDDALASKDTLHNAALGLWIGAGSAALLTAAYAIFAFPSPSNSVTVVPTLGPTHAGLSTTLSF